MEVIDCQQYYVHINSDDAEDSSQANASLDEENIRVEEQSNGVNNGFAEFLQLPQIQIPPILRTRLEPRINYHRSILLTKDCHFQDLEDMVIRREVAIEEQKRRKLKKKATKEQRAQDKGKKIQEKQERAGAAKWEKLHNELWSVKSV